MHTVSEIVADINRGCTANNLNEDRFQYRIIFFVNEGDKGSKHYTDTTYSGLHEALENIIRGNLSLTNSVVIAETTVLKDGKCVRLQSRSYSFSLEEYFRQIKGERMGGRGKDSIVYGKYAVRHMNG